MIPYIALTISITILPFFFSNKTEKKRVKGKKITCIISFVLLLALMGFRNESMGMYDTQYVYHPIFNSLLNINFGNITDIVNSQQGLLMYYIMKIFQIFSKDYNQWVFFSSIPFLAVYSIFVYKRCNKATECMFAFMFFIFIRIFTSGFYLQRHFFAMTFFLLAYDALLEKKYIRYVIFAILAFSVHPTAIFVVLLYPLSKMRLNGKQAILLIAAYFGVTLLGKNIFNTLFTYLSVSDYSYYAHYFSSRGFDVNTIGIVLTVLLLIYYAIIKLFSIKDDYVLEAFNLFAVGTVLTMGSSFISEMYRIAYFFLVCGIPGFSIAIGQIKKRNERIICFCIIYGLLCVYFWPVITDARANLYPYISMFK
ncbi:hypothetical protein GH811_03480 [Acetobacterium malicum]|uniref:EpsG family protein n=1 Tax=Acetobacterium malicum TaxID=52692 RepID=A0ABR6YU07_9FIRM|nr:EpsG family protein [Acetobacterium malicum]MBC3898674.1 hypothetical protein [Acetobacterium malicum]